MPPKKPAEKKEKKPRMTKEQKEERERKAKFDKIKSEKNEAKAKFDKIPLTITFMKKHLTLVNKLIREENPTIKGVSKMKKEDLKKIFNRLFTPVYSQRRKMYYYGINKDAPAYIKNIDSEDDFMNLIKTFIK